MDFTVDVDLNGKKGKEHDNMDVLLSGMMMMMMISLLQATQAFNPIF